MMPSTDISPWTFPKSMKKNHSICIVVVACIVLCFMTGGGIYMILEQSCHPIPDSTFFVIPVFIAILLMMAVAPKGSYGYAPWIIGGILCMFSISQLVLFGFNVFDCAQTNDIVVIILNATCAAVFFVYSFTTYFDRVRYDV